MQGFAIVKVVVDAIGAKENIVQQFNEYMQREVKVPSFIHEREGYFRLGYNERVGAASAPIEKFGRFLESSGYTVSGISGTKSLEGENATVVSFVKDGREAQVVLSTVNVY